jgi:hypothetical protein
MHHLALIFPLLESADGYNARDSAGKQPDGNHAACRRVISAKAARPSFEIGILEERIYRVAGFTPATVIVPPSEPSPAAAWSARRGVPMPSRALRALRFPAATCPKTEASPGVTGKRLTANIGELCRHRSVRADARLETFPDDVSTRFACPSRKCFISLTTSVPSPSRSSISAHRSAKPRASAALGASGVRWQPEGTHNIHAE